MTRASTETDGDRLFAGARSRLLGLAYRILGSRSDAEDAVQDTYLRWKHADRDEIENPTSWLTAVCTRRCLDLLRSAHRARVDYVGQWLPEPILTETPVEDRLDLAASLTTAFLLMLERLTPKERAAYLLHEIFDVSYREVAETLATPEPACRKLVSRARTNIARAKVRHTTPVERQNELLAAFRAAVTGGTTTELKSLLSDDVRLHADGGGKVPAIREILEGTDRVLAFIDEGLRTHWASFRWTHADINGSRGILLSEGGTTVATVSFAYDERGLASGIYIVRNPEKLGRLDRNAIQ